MNVLHNITPSEALVSQGTYNYRLANRTSGLKEEWSIHQHDDELIHRAEVSGRIGQIALRQLTHLSVGRDYRPKRLEIHQTINSNEAKTQVVFSADTLEQSIDDNGETSLITLPLPAKFGLFFPPVSGQGFILHNYDDETGGRQDIPMLTVRMQPFDAPSLSIELRQVSYEYIAHEEVETLAGQFACRHFKRHDETMTQDLWLDEAGMVVQWNVPQSEIMTWEYVLTQYQRNQ